ncbi:MULTISPECIES: serine/threonine-protein kinase [unclassified Nocardiopsis]|uniref:serine/threonine-protein kinase n=1 Tax=unclassified Nocardiopsis TaxID=2649073 RepID=UPI001F24E02A|nr:MULTISPECIES: serine/threonine-protein kinase [unclassified Nocardiopsis]
MTTPLLPSDPTRIGRYAVSARIGSGGQGTVYLARAEDGTPVAVKVLTGSWGGDTRQRERFAKELAAARRVAPFCTAAVLDADMRAEVPFIASEYVPGPTLREAVRREGPRTGAALERLAIATVTALAAVHQAGVVHRDLKPGNVILGPDGPRVIDFGIARVLDATQQTTTVAGTPAYMSPEQVRGAPVGPSSDMFSWAAVMAYAATGHHAFPGDDTMAVIDRVLRAEPELDDVPEPLRSVLRACLAKEPADRPGAVAVLGWLIGREMPVAEPTEATQILAEVSTAVDEGTARIRLPVRGWAVPEAGPRGGEGAVRQEAAGPEKGFIAESPTLPQGSPGDGGAGYTGPVLDKGFRVEGQTPALPQGGPGDGGAGYSGGGSSAPGPEKGFIAESPTLPQGTPGDGGAGFGGGEGTLPGTDVPPPVRPRGGRRSAAALRRRRTAGWAATGAATVLAVLGGLLFWATQQEPPRAEPTGSTPSVESPDTSPVGDGAPVTGEASAGPEVRESIAEQPSREEEQETQRPWTDCDTDPHAWGCARTEPPECTHESCAEPTDGEGDGTGDGHTDGDGTGGGDDGTRDGGGTGGGDTGGGDTGTGAPQGGGEEPDPGGEDPGAGRVDEEAREPGGQEPDTLW